LRGIGQALAARLDAGIGGTQRHRPIMRPANSTSSNLLIELVS